MIASLRLNDATHGSDPINIDRTRELVNALNNTVDLLPTLDEL